MQNFCKTCEMTLPPSDLVRMFTKLLCLSALTLALSWFSVRSSSFSRAISRPLELETNFFCSERTIFRWWPVVVTLALISILKLNVFEPAVFAITESKDSVCGTKCSKTETKNKWMNEFFWTLETDLFRQNRIFYIGQIWNYQRQLQIQSHIKFVCEIGLSQNI